MASSLPVIIFLFLSIHFFPVSISSETLVFPLTHSLSSSNKFNTTHHLLKDTSTRSAARFHHRRKTHRHRQISLPLAAGSDYTLSFTIGSHSQPHPISLYMDTGSDLVWFPCSRFQCILCEGKPHGGAATNLSSSAVKLPCKSPSCAAAHSSPSSSDLCAIAGCPLESIETSECDAFSCPNFYYAYGDGSLVATLYRDSLALHTASPPLILQNFTFGCSHSTLGEPVGVAGFGHGVLSLPAQLANLSPQLGGRFSYCLVSHSFDSDRIRHPSPLILGRVQDETINPDRQPLVYAPMLYNPKHPYFYSIALTAITVGASYIAAPSSLRRVDSAGNGGMVVDSGTTFTMLPSKLFEAFAAELDRKITTVYKRASETEGRTGLGPCYYVKGNSGKVIPRVTFHFSKNSSVVLPTRNYFYEFMDGSDEAKKRKVGCLMVMSGRDESESDGGPAATLGNYQQQGFEVVYDLEERKIGFARRKCASMWESLSQH